MGAHGDLGHAANIAEAAAAVDDLVSDEAALWFARNRALIGSEADVEAHLDRLREQGVAGVTMTQHSGAHLPDRLIETLGPLIRRFGTG
jgi:alkanesulfonate monooxygenase SsuD/methylene tetrahydromethanopterin reductase-like flavin-dependent oxidoreductase (luciferase family)